MNERFVLNQRDNKYYAHIGSRSSAMSGDSQCAIASHGGALLSIAYYFDRALSAENVEESLAAAIDFNYSLGPTDYAAKLGVPVTAPALSAMFGYRGSPTSTNALYAASREVLMSVGLDLHPLDPDNCDYYADGTPRCQELDRMSATDSKAFFLGLLDSLSKGSAVVCMGDFTRSGHYVNVLEATDYGLKIGDPYGTPNMGEPSYLKRNPKEQPTGTIYSMTWEQVSAKRLTARVITLRGVTA